MSESDRRSEHSSVDDDSEECYMISLYDYTPKEGFGQTCLHLKEGDIVKVVQKKDGEWWCGECNGKKGWFPHQYVKPTSKRPSDVFSDRASTESGALVVQDPRYGQSAPQSRHTSVSNISADLLQGVKHGPMYGDVNVLEMSVAGSDVGDLSSFHSHSSDHNEHDSYSEFSDECTDELVRIHINSRLYTVRPGNVLSACHSVGVYVASLCYHPRLPPLGKCKSCVIEVVDSPGPAKIQSACTTPVVDGMIVRTNTEETKKVMASAINNMLRARFNRSLPPLSVKRRQTELIQAVKNARAGQKDVSNGAVMRDTSLCIECGRCIQACRELQGMSIYTLDSADDQMPLKTYNDRVLHDTICMACGQCTSFCPSGALTEIPDAPHLLRALGRRTTVAIVAPAVRVSISEGFGLRSGTNSQGKLVSALKAIGFNYVFDNQFTSDLTVMEEGTELLDRLKGHGVLPMFTSCCSGWVNMLEKVYPKLLPHLSSCRSPQGMMGSLVRTFFAEKLGVAGPELFVVGIMPCVAKKTERARPQLSSDGVPDVDCVLTTRELIEVFDMKGIDFARLPDQAFDDPLGRSTGAAALFAVSGGVMEAAVRTAYELATHKKLEQLSFSSVRGTQAVKEATVPLLVPIRKSNMRVAVINGGAAAREICEKVMAGKCGYDFIEVMACPGGCIGGGGQPQSGDVHIVEKRMNGHYTIDETSSLRKSHENPSIQIIYKDFLVNPNSHRAHMLLHTMYEDRSSEAKEAVVEAQEMTYNMSARSKKNKKNKKFSKKNFVLLYATQTGNAWRACHWLEEKLQKSGYKVEVCRFDMYPFENLELETCTVIFVTSTFWDGEFPESGQALWKKIRDRKAKVNLTKLQYAVFGVGSSTYPHYCRAATRLDDSIMKGGAKQFLPCGKGDVEDQGGYMVGLEAWTNKLLAAIKQGSNKKSKA